MRRIASDLEMYGGPWAKIHASIADFNSEERRMFTMGVTPVAGRPFLFCVSVIDFVI